MIKNFLIASLVAVVSAQQNLITDSPIISTNGQGALIETHDLEDRVFKKILYPTEPIYLD